MTKSTILWQRISLAISLLSLSLAATAQIRIGMPSGFTGSVAAGVKENAAGARLYIDAINAKGGVNGQRIEFIMVDDHFDPKQTVAVARDLIEKQKVVALFLNRGTPHTLALKPLLAEKRVPLVAPSTGAMALHQPVDPWIFNVRAPYQQEAAKAIAHLASIGVTHIALFQTDDAFGSDGAEGARKGLASAGLKAVFEEKVPRDKPDFSAVAARAAKEGVQAVMVIASAGNTASAVKALRAAGSRAQVVTLSNNASGGFIGLLGDQARGVIVTQVFPNEHRIRFRLIKEAQDLARSQGLAGITPAMMEGFSGAKVLVEGLRRAGQNPSPEGLRDALERMNNFDLGDLPVGYGPEDHSGLEFADLSIIDASGRFRR